MNKRWSALAAVGLAWMAAAMVLVWSADQTGSVQPKVADLSGLAWAAAPEAEPTIIEVDPASAPNDLDTPIVITGTGFAAVPTVTLDSTLLEEVGRVSSATLTATVPWGVDPGVYTLTAVNPGGESGSLPGAFTVTQGIGVWTTGGPYGGAILGLALHPVTPTTVYALASNAGVFASFDAAATWEPILLDATPYLVVPDAEDPAVMYFGGGRLLRTKDGGSTWESILPPGGHGAFYPAAHPITSGVVYVGGSAHPGLFRSDDYGESWLELTVGPTETLVKAIAFHPYDPDKMLAGTPDGNVFLSSDGGKTWDWRAKISSHVERLYFNPFGAHEAWATTEVVDGPHYDPPHYLYKSADPELGVWTPITVAEGPGEGNVVQSLTFLSDTIWSAGAEGFTSTDGGVSWSPVSTAGSPPGRTGDTKAFAIDPGNPDVVYAANIGHGIFRSTDGGVTWSKRNEGLAAVVPRELAVSPTDPDTIYADTYALGVLKSSNGGHSWLSLGIGEVGFAHPLAVDPLTATRVYMGDEGPGYIRLQISEDAGSTWVEVTATMPTTFSGWNSGIAVVAPHPMAPTMTGHILAGIRFWPPGRGDFTFSLGEGAMYSSHDHGKEWHDVGPTQPISAVVGFAYDAAEPDLVYAATYGTGLWKSADGGTSWGQVTSYPGAHWLWSVTAHPDVPGLVFVDCDQAPIGDPTLFVSQNAGETWTGLPPCDDCDNLLFVPPERGKRAYALYAGSLRANGLFRTRDGGYTWEQVAGSPTTDIYSLAAGSDEERVVVYVGVSGGVVPFEELAEAASEVIPGLGGLWGGGVYRFTSLMLGGRLYLPLVMRQE